MIKKIAKIYYRSAVKAYDRKINFIRPSPLGPLTLQPLHMAPHELPNC